VLIPSQPAVPHLSARNTLTALSLVLALLPAHLSAQQRAQPAAKHDARTDRLQGLSRADLQRLAPALARGPVALIEFADKKTDELPAINLATIVHAPARDVVALLRNPRGYPRFMRTLDEVKVVSDNAHGLVYDWRWQVALFSLTGRSALTVFEPPKERPDVGYRIAIDSQSGDFGAGRITLRVLPRGERECMLTIAMRLDLRAANYVARKLAKAARSINRSANMSLAYTLLLSTRREAETRAGYKDQGATAPQLHKPQFAAADLLPLLVRGDLVLLDMRGDQLDQLAVFGLIQQPSSLVRTVMLDADGFGAALLPGSSAEVVSRKDKTTTFDWDIDLPLIGVSGRMQMRDADGVVAVAAIDGALSGGRWNFEPQKLTPEVTMMAGWASFDLRTASWFMRSLADADPYLGHGMSAASQVMLMRAIRSRSDKRAKLAQATAAK
jgi:hypothetical protein